MPSSYLSVGFIGVGHITSYLVEGFYRAKAPYKLILSPRNEAKSKALHQHFNATIAASNQAVIDQSDIIFLCLKPDILLDVVSELNVAKDKKIISIAAGVGLDDLQQAIPLVKIVRSMPITTAAIMKSPSIIYPADQEVETLLNYIGSAHLLENEQQFTAASTMSALYGWNLALMNEIIKWGEAQDINATTMRDLVAKTFESSALIAQQESAKSFDKILESIASPGGITEHGINVIKQNNGLIPWQVALESTYKKMQQS